MAKIINVDGVKHVNVNEAVGRNGVNDSRDVLAVQALLAYALEGKPQYKGVRFPVPNGTLCSLTRELIKKYQRERKRKDSGVRVDGRIDPARGLETRGRKVIWTILALNLDAIEAWFTAKNMGSNHIDAMCRIYPGMRRAVGLEGVGTLGLELEGGGVGSLGLELE